MSLVTWTEPKTNWAATDTFYLDPDYNRISGNISYLSNLAKSLYGNIAISLPVEYAISSIIYDDFFNDIVNSTNEIRQKTFLIPDWNNMRLYDGNGPIWDETDLNYIEENILKLYEVLSGQQNILPKLAFQLNGSDF